MPTITVFGATGSQGSSVVDAGLADGKYAPHAVSRNVDCAANKALIVKGVEVIVGNLFDKESLMKAIRGSEAVFGVANFWDPEVFPADPEGKSEIVQGKKVGVKFFIWRHVVFSFTVGQAVRDLSGTRRRPHRRRAALQLHRSGQGRAGQVVPSYQYTYDIHLSALAAAIAKVIGKEATFISVESAGIAEPDEMFLYQAKFKMYVDTPVPNPDLIALGVQFGSMEEFIATEVVPCMNSIEKEHAIEQEHT
ncbi:hypothetical protein DFH07DRAFT_967072 [Mycena maculata]|uniref:NmrA-like domain-containing protein n=1 Tax=Mycena maculata TaxID=230809 RepID=A0AAD7I7G5_9AGAR|nr:hypothetical protein DFH07DRAFT_967072 [Mycena maculata]